MPSEIPAGVGTPVLHGFRFRFQLTEHGRLPLDEQEFNLSDGENRVILLAAGHTKPIRDVSLLAVEGYGYPSSDKARAEGEAWRDRIQIAFARLGIGATFFERLPPVSGKPGLVPRTTGGHMYVVPDIDPEVTVFTFPPQPDFFSARASIHASPSPDRVRTTLRESTSSDLRYSDQERLAFALYGDSFFATTVDTRLLILMNAIEVLIDQEPRSAQVLKHVQDLIDLTAAADIPQSEARSIVGSLKWLRVQSIGQAGRHLASRLDGRTYMGMSPEKFFSNCYEIRSSLTHGHLPRADWKKVDPAASALSRFVGDLLAYPQSATSGSTMPA